MVRAANLYLGAINRIKGEQQRHGGGEICADCHPVEKLLNPPPQVLTEGWVSYLTHKEQKVSHTASHFFLIIQKTFRIVFLLLGCILKLRFQVRCKTLMFLMVE